MEIMIAITKNRIIITAPQKDRENALQKASVMGIICEGEGEARTGQNSHGQIVLPINTDREVIHKIIDSLIDAMEPTAEISSNVVTYVFAGR